LGLGILALLPGVSASESPESALKGLRKHYQALKTLNAEFREVFEWAMTGETVEQKGSFVIAGDDRFRFDTPEQLLVSDGTAVYRWNRSKQQTIIESVAASGNKMLPRKFMVEFGDDFRPVSVSDLTVDNAPGYRLDLEPFHPEEALLSKITLWVTRSDNLVRRLKLVDLSQNATTYYLTEIKLNEAVFDSLFVFSPPPGVEIFDLR
ncbi:MAG: outer membrane lipoprotein carrier protein LolA, partial [Calditrichota bacterium]